MGKLIANVLLFWLLLLASAWAGSWAPGAALQTGRAGLSAERLGDKIYAAGGSGLLAPLGDVENYQAGGGGWQVLTDLPVGLESFGLAALEGKLYAAGGYAEDTKGKATARMWIFDPGIGVWTQGPDMPTARAAFALAAAAGRLYAFGGAGPGAGSIFVFDPKAGAWSTLAHGLSGSRDLAAAVLGTRIYLIGGGPAASPLARVQVFNITDQSWTQGPALPKARSGHAVAVLDGKIHVLGGRGGGRGETLDDHWVLDPALGQWHAAEALPTPRTGAAAVALKGALYLIGGGSGGGFFAPFTAIAVTDIWRPDKNR